MLRKSKSPPPPRRLQNTAPLPPPEVMDDATFLCVLLALILTIIALVCLISPYLWTSGRPGILLSKDGTTWEAAHWSSYDVNSPPSGDNNSTRVIISLTRVTAKLVHGEDLSLSFMLMQQWSDPRLVVRGGENSEWKFYLKFLWKSCTYVKKIASKGYKTNRNFDRNSFNVVHIILHMHAREIGGKTR